MFTFQENTHFSQALPCTKEAFWEQVKKQTTAWRINARRAILAAVEASKTEGVAALQSWLSSSEYQKFDLKRQNLKKKSAKEAWAKKTDAEKLKAYAQDLKENLPAFIFSCYKFDATESAKGQPFCHRRLKDCHLNGLVMLDIDHVENPMQIWWQLRDNAELMTRTKLLYITSSGNGLRIIFTADSSLGNLADNQIVFANALGQKADASCIDATRNSFSPKEEDILFIDETIFDYYDEDFDKMFTAAYRDEKTQPINHRFDTDDGADGSIHSKSAALSNKAAQEGSGTVGSVDDQSLGNGVKWRGYDLQAIINQRYADKLPCKDDSNRHAESLKLATDLMLMLDGDKKLVQTIVERQSWVQEIIEERDEDVAQTVESAAKQLAKKEETTSKPYPSKAMQAAILAVTGLTYRELISESAAESSETARTSIEKKLQQWGEEIEGMFDDFPLLRDVCEGLKKSQYPAAMFVAGGVMMTLMTRTWYRFYHRPQQERRLNCSLFIIGHPASNKSMADDIYEVLSTPIAAADKAGLAALNRYKQDQKKKAANKEGKDKPQGIIRIHPARTSNGQLIQDMLNAKETIEGKEIQLHLFTFDTELDNSTTLQQGGSWINKQSMELKAFHNEKDGQMYQNSDSPVDEFRVTWNFIYTGTPIALKRKVNERNFGSGLSTRLAVIPMPKTNFEMIGFEDKTAIDWQRLERMKTWAYRLDSRFGELPFWGIVKKLYDWTKDRMADCEEDDNEANELMLKRVAYHAINYSAPFIDARHWDKMKQKGSYWVGEYETDETDWKLCELIARIQYATQQHFFGVLAEKYFDDMNNDVQFTGKRHYQKSVEGYNRLPDIFTFEDLKRSFGYNSDASAYSKIRRMMENNIIAKSKEKGKYQKLKQLISD
ncbi:MAG: hypothetical protein J6I38_00620 [Prevotella sp.]|nr:hypothetical protein [Prevotella sp.]